MFFDLKCSSCGHLLIDDWCPFGDAEQGQCTATPKEVQEARDADRYRWRLLTWRFFAFERSRWGFGALLHWFRDDREIELSIGPFHIFVSWERTWVRAETAGHQDGPGHRRPDPPGTSGQEVLYG